MRRSATAWAYLTAGSWRACFSGRQRALWPACSPEPLPRLSFTGCCAGAKAGIPGWSPPGVWRRSSCLASSSHTCSWASPWPWVPRCSSHGWASSALPGRSTSRSRCLPGIESADRRGLWSLRLRLKSLRVALIRRHKNVHERLVTVAGTRLRRVCALRPQIWSLDLCASTL
uniref:Uncharacterized protein n=1 Tax=Ixodes scapularis TaxID=6945 RepID=A0A4D5RAZ4_IXOSC